MTALSRFAGGPRDHDGMLGTRRARWLHFHLVVPDALFSELEGGGVSRHDLGAPMREELERLLGRVVKRAVEMLRARRLLEQAPVADALVPELMRMPGSPG